MFRIVDERGRAVARTRSRATAHRATRTRALGHARVATNNRSVATWLFGESEDAMFHSGAVEVLVRRWFRVEYVDARSSREEWAADALVALDRWADEANADFVRVYPIEIASGDDEGGYDVWDDYAVPLPGMDLRETLRGIVGRVAQVDSDFVPETNARGEVVLHDGRRPVRVAAGPYR